MRFSKILLSTIVVASSALILNADDVKKKDFSPVIVIHGWNKWNGLNKIGI